MLPTVLLFLSILQPSFGFIAVDFNCTTYTSNFVYSQSANSCSNVMSNELCEMRYERGPNVAMYPTPGRNDARPALCYSYDGGVTLNTDAKKIAVQNCPKTCGYCCETEAYSCQNHPSSTIDCSKVTLLQCTSTQWKAMLAANCPSTCGLCLERPCEDVIPTCSSDLSICTDPNKTVYVDTFCRKTCGKCFSLPSTVSYTSSSPPPGDCLFGYPPDNSQACPTWAEHGFCSSTLYSTAQKKEYCATTCKLCF